MPEYYALIWRRNGNHYTLLAIHHSRSLAKLEGILATQGLQPGRSPADDWEAQAGLIVGRIKQIGANL